MHPRKYSDDEKQHILANLDIEVAHRVRQFESQLADTLENFRIHGDGQVSRVPKQLRTLTMAEFIDRYDGDLQAALRGVQKERLERMGTALSTDLDRTERKRKWISSFDIPDPGEGESSNAVKFPRMASPRKKVPGTPSRLRMPKTPGTAHQPHRYASAAPPSPSPAKYTLPPRAGSVQPHLQTQRPPSPTKTHFAFPTASSSNHTQRSASNPNPSRRPPSSSFNPTLPPLPQLGSWRPPGFASVPEEGEPPARRHQRTNSFVLRKPTNRELGHARTWSQTSSMSSSTQPSSSSLRASPSDSLHDYERDHNLQTPRPLARTASALVSVPLADGQLLEFDPLQASPGALEQLEGVSDSAKKHAREEMVKLVEAAVRRWKIQ